MNTPVHVLSLADERRVETRTSVTDIFRSNAGDCFDLKTLTEPLRFHPILPMPGLVCTVFRLTHYFYILLQYITFPAIACSV